MSELRPFALVRDGDQWVRGGFDRTFLDYESGIVELAWTTTTKDSTTPAPSLGAGLAFDNECRLYHSRPASGSVDRVRWSTRDALSPDGGDAAITSFLGGAPLGPLGDFDGGASSSVLREPRGLAVDENDRLFVAESGGRQVLVYDLWSERLLRRVQFGGQQPMDLAARGAMVWVVVAPAGRVELITAAGGPDPVTLPAGCVRVSRIAVSPGGLLALLCDTGTSGAEIWILDRDGKERDRFPEPFATDVEWESDSVLVSARRPGADFTRVRIDRAAREILGPLRARGYDGLGIVRTPDRLPEAPGHECHCGGTCGCASFRIGYWTSRAFRLAVPARLEYERLGRVTTYRLDSGAFQTRWGRVFLDACIPPGTDVRIHAIALDESDDATALRVVPANLAHVTISRPDLSPPMPPLTLVPDDDEVQGRLHERESGRELPWTQPGGGDPFSTYEGWIEAPAGRYLWLTLELRGNTRVTPRIRCIRAEHPAHDYLRRVPRLFSRDEQDASFLRRYLAIFEGFLGETEARGVDRDVLLTPRTAPDEVLPWLASFLGLVLDERWAQAPRPGGRTADARREIIELAAWLFRFRGTVPGLKRFIELYVGVEIVLLEHFRLRARMSAMLGGAGAAASSSMIGVGFRLGDATVDPATAGATAAAADSHAHRFTVLIPASLNAEQLDVVRQILLVHRPAHTIFDVCTVGAGMRVGHGLHIGVSSMIGATGGFSTWQLGGNALGRGAIIGRPAGGTTVDATRVGPTSRVR